MTQNIRGRTPLSADASGSVDVGGHAQAAAGVARPLEAMINVTPLRLDSGTARTRKAVRTGPPSVGTAASSCTVCRSPKRATIDAALAASATGRAVASAHGFSKSAIARHSAKCLPAKIARAAVARKDQVTAAGLLDAMVALQRTTQEQLDLAVAAKMKPVDVTKLTKEVRENVGMMGRFLGAFVGENAKSIDNSVKILALRDMSIDELRALTDALRSRSK